MSKAAIRFGFNNRVPFATLTSDPTPLTNLDYIKNELRSRATFWDVPNESGNIVVNGTLIRPQNSEFMSLPNVNDIGDAEFKLELYLSPDVNLDLLEMPFTPAVKNDLGDLIPLGEWAAGIDAYGVPVNAELGTLPDTFTYYFGKRVYYDSFKLTMRRASTSTEQFNDVKMRMLYLGDVFEAEHTFSFGNTIKFLTSPNLRQTASGSWIPTRRQNRSRMIELSLDMMSDKDRNALYQLESTLLGEAFIVTAYPDSTLPWQYNNYNMLARFGEPIEYTQRYLNVHQSTLSLLEV